MGYSNNNLQPISRPVPRRLPQPNAKNVCRDVKSGEYGQITGELDLRTEVELEFYVAWKGYASVYNEWVTVKGLGDCKGKVWGVRRGRGGVPVQPKAKALCSVDAWLTLSRVTLQLYEYIQYVRASKCVPLPGDIDIVVGGPPCQVRML